MDPERSAGEKPDPSTQARFDRFTKRVSNLGSTLDTAIRDLRREPSKRTASQSVLLNVERKIIDAARCAKGLDASEPKESLINSTAIPRDYFGLAFSGGGIRSATFNLGVLQGLAKSGLLRHVDYLSTVSGGGYIGTWLVAWLKRLAEPANAGKGEPVGAHEALKSLENLLKDQKKCPEPILHLRRYSNYLTPVKSFFSADTWTLAAIWSRNLLLNLTIITCLITLVMVIPRYLGLGASWLARSGAAGPQLLWEPGIALIILAYCAGVISYYLHQVSGRALEMEDKKVGMEAEIREVPNKDQVIIQLQIVLPLLLASGVAAIQMLRNPYFFKEHWISGIFPSLAVCFAIITTFGGFSAGFARRNASRRESRPALKFLGVLLGLPIAAVSGFVTAAALFGLSRVFEGLGAGWKPWACTVLGPPAILLALAVGVVCLVGLMGPQMPDAGREWLGRLRAWSTIYAIFWVIVFGASIYGPWLLYKAGIWAASSAGGAWLLTTIGGRFAGKSSQTSGEENQSKSMKKHGREALAVLAPYVFMAGLFLLVAGGIHELVSPAPRQDLRHDPGKTITLSGKPEDMAITIGSPERRPYNHFEARANSYASDLMKGNIGLFNEGQPGLRNLSMLLLIAIVAGLLLAWRVDINEFSMHYFYKNRLVRAYLGASRNRRDPDKFTGFDSGDDFPLASLSYIGRKDVHSPADFASKVYCGPYPIINGTLNLSGANALAWQERRAASYIFTPFFSGYEKELVDREAGGETGTQASAYRLTKMCGGADGIEIGAAMAISGAAANPNCGFHTSTAVAFFLSVLNARLGCWLGNPARDDCYYKSSPRWGLPYLVLELFGSANKNKGYVNVSDGGHFENLGIYELVRRRCKYIIACDAEQDGGLTFGGLAGAIRKCSADFGVEIKIDLDRLRLTPNRFSAAHCAVGEIDYGDEKGYLIYLKSSVTGDEDSDVLEYRSRNAAFPHESTADQWFDESQFESYRSLGFHVAETAFGAIKRLDERKGCYAGKKQEFFDEIKMMHYPPSKVIRQSFTRHTDHLMRILESFAGDNQFAKYDRSILRHWSDMGSLFQQSDRKACYWCMSLLQLMEDVYVDLNLQAAAERDHPENAGWMQLFRSWSVTPLFRQTWEMSGSTYGARFRRFFEELREGETGRVLGRWTSEGIKEGSLTPVVLDLIAPPDRLCDLSGKVKFGTEESRSMEDLDFNGASLAFKCDQNRRRCIMHFKDASVDRDGHYHNALLTINVDDQPPIRLNMRREEPGLKGQSATAREAAI